MNATSARLMLYSKAQEVLGVEEAAVLMDMLTPGEMFEAWRSDTQAGFALLRAQMESSETALHRRIDETNHRLDSLELKVDRGFDAIDQRFVRMEAKYDGKFLEMETKFEHMEAKFDKNFADMEAKFGNKFEHMDAKFDKKFADADTKFDKKFDTLENRIMTRMSRLVLGVGIPFALSNIAILVTIVTRT